MEPETKSLHENFKNFLTFLNDSCFDGYTPQEIGENFARVMICSEDVTVFNFKFYGVFLNQHQEKKSKKKKQGKNSLPEIFMHILKHACHYLKSFVRFNKTKLKVSEEEFNYFKEREQNMDYELLESLSTVLSKYSIDDPIVEPTLRLFESIDFRNK